MEWILMIIISVVISAVISAVVTCKVSTTIYRNALEYAHKIIREKKQCNSEEASK